MVPTVLVGPRGTFTASGEELALQVSRENTCGNNTNRFLSRPRASCKVTPPGHATKLTNNRARTNNPPPPPEVGDPMRRVCALRTRVLVPVSMATPSGGVRLVTGWLLAGYRGDFWKVYDTDPGPGLTLVGPWSWSDPGLTRVLV